MKIPLNDGRWARTQKPAIIQFFLDCWLSDPYGSRWVQLSTELKSTAFKEAKKKLSNQGLFVFKPEPSIQDGRATVCWLVKNLHGSRIKEFWKEVAPTALEVAPTTLEVAPTALEVALTTSISPQTLTQSGVQNASRSSQDLFQDLSQDLIQEPEEKERKNEQKCLEQEEEGNQGDGKPEGTSAPQSSASLKDQPKVNAKPKDSKLDQPSGGGAAALQKSTGIIQQDWEIAPGEPYPNFVKWLAKKYELQGGHWAINAEANARAEIRNNPQRAADLWREFLKYSNHAADTALAHKAAGMTPTLPSCFQESPDPIKEDVAAKLAAIAPTRNPTLHQA